MILSDEGIRDRIKKNEIKIDPLSEGSIQSASVDLKLGFEFIIIKHWNSEILNFRSEPKYQSVQTDQFLLPSHSFVLATTIETVQIPPDLTAFVEGRSSIGRMGLFIQNAGLVDPGYKGQLTLELYNANSLPIRLDSGWRICQIVFHKMDQKTTNPYKGKYQGQKGVTGTRISEDKENSVKPDKNLL